MGGAAMDKLQGTLEPLCATAARPARLAFAFLRTLKNAVRDVRNLPTDLRASRKFHEGLESMNKEHRDHKELPYRHAGPGGVRSGWSKC